MRRVFVAGLFVLAAAVPYAPRASATVDLQVDRDTLSSLLATMVPPDVPLELAGGNVVTLRIREFRVNGFDPDAGPRGQVLTSFRLEVPELGLRVPVQPRLSLHVTEKDGQALCNLRFEDIRFAVPFAGAMNIAPLLPEIPVPADEVTAVETPGGIFRVRTRLIDARVGADTLDLSFRLDVEPAP